MLENNQNKNLVLIEDLGMLYPNKISNKKYRYGIYKCFCGNEFKARTQDIKGNMVKSCKYCSKEKMKNAHTIHGLRYHRLYKIWSEMIRRCTNPKHRYYKNYGERGIKVCDEWLNIHNFINDMYSSYKEGLTLDRIDVNSGYSKNNCRWATKSIQSRNIRKIRANNTSGYKGVSRYKNKWKAEIRIKSKSIYLGLFNEPLEAALAYDKYIIDNNLEHTRNF